MPHDCADQAGSEAATAWVFAALVYLIVVILDIAPVQDVIPSHYAPDDEESTG
jgi:uncharacterized MAPEG superfamily protein